MPVSNSVVSRGLWSVPNTVQPKPAQFSASVASHGLWVAERPSGFVPPPPIIQVVQGITGSIDPVTELSGTIRVCGDSGNQGTGNGNGSCGC